MENQLLMPGDSTLIESIVNYLKAKGIFDEFRHECLADVDTKPSCQNLSQRVDGFTSKFLATETWHPDMNKNELRNKLRRHIDESGMLTIGADHVVEQVINPKIGHLFYPRIREIVPQYLSEENEKLNKKLQVTNEELTEKGTTEYSDANSSKTSKPVVLDPIADILAFSSSKSKPINQNVTPVKIENPMIKNLDTSKLEKKKDEKYPSQLLKSDLLEKKKDDKVPQPVKMETTDKKKEEKITLKVEFSEKKKDEICITSPLIKSETVENEEKCIQLSTKVEILEKIKDEKVEPDSSESTILASASEIKQEDDESAAQIDIGKQVKLEDSKPDSFDNSKNIDSSITTGEMQNKTSNIPVSTKSGISSKKFDKTANSKNKLKLNISSVQKSSSTNVIQKLKIAHKVSKSSEKFKKHSTKLLKSSKDLLPPTKKDSSLKSPKDGEINAKKKSDDSISRKNVDSSFKKSILKSTSMKKDISSKNQTMIEKSEKHKASKSDQQQATTAGKNIKSSIQYSSSYDSSQGSDQDRSISILKKERQKHFSKSVKKENSDKKGDPSGTGVSVEKHSKDNPDSKDVKKGKFEKTSKMIDRAKESKETSKAFSRSSSFGSTSSVSSLSSVSKDVSTSEESAESPTKKLKKKVKESSKDKCHNYDRKFQPPPPPPPPSNIVPSSSSFPSTDEIQSSQSSQEDKDDSDRESISGSSSDSEIEERTLCSESLVCSKLNDTASPSTSSTYMNDINDIFLYSSSSSEFEGFCSSPEKRKVNERDSEDSKSVSSVHTSDLSSYDDEISVGDISSDESIYDDIDGDKITLEKAKEIIERKEKELIAAEAKKKHEVEEEYVPPNNVRKRMHVSSEEDASSQEPKRMLRRERKLNPKYASNEYTSIFTSKIKSFITKQDTDKESKSSKESISNNMFNKPNLEDVASKVKVSEKSSLNSLNKSHQKNTVENSEQCKPLRIKNYASTSIREVSTDKKSSKHKRKLDLDGTSENPISKRPCSRSSIDSSSSEFASNENKPFNNEKVNSGSPSEKLNNIQKECKDSAVMSENLKKEVPYKHKTNNNGDILNKIEPLKKNSQSKVLSNNEKKDAESNLEVTTL